MSLAGGGWMSRQLIIIVGIVACMLPCSCEESCRPRLEQITGTWSGVAEDYSDFSPADAPILLVVAEHNSKVSGTLSAIGQTDSLYSGTFRSGELLFTLRSLPDDLEHEFTGLIIPPASAESLAAALERLVIERGELERLTRNALDNRQCVSIENYEVNLVAELLRPKKWD